MKLISIVLFLTCTAAFALDEPLHVGTVPFAPPFNMRGTHNSIYGFDIDTMNALCKIIRRTCTYHLMKFDELLPAVASKKVDVAIGQITITPERAQKVAFTLPYLLSYSRFIQLSSARTDAPFSLSLFNEKTIGIISGTVFAQQLKQLEIKNAEIYEYPKPDSLLEALRNGDVDFILINNSTANYWADHSDGAFSVVGTPLMYGFGFGIAVSLDNQELVKQLNEAIVSYENSPGYTNSYDTYLLEW